MLSDRKHVIENLKNKAQKQLGFQYKKWSTSPMKKNTLNGYVTQLQQNYHCYKLGIGYRIYFKYIKTLHEKERPLKLKIFEIQQAIAKLLSSSHNLAIVTAK